MVRSAPAGDSGPYLAGVTSKEGLLFAGFVFGEVGAAFVVVEVVVDGVVLAGIAAGDLGAAAVVFLVLLSFALILFVHIWEFSRGGRA